MKKKRCGTCKQILDINTPYVMYGDKIFCDMECLKKYLEKEKK